MVLAENIDELRKAIREVLREELTSGDTWIFTLRRRWCGWLTQTGFWLAS